MAKLKKLGFSWGDVGINLVEVNKDAALAAASISFASLESDPILGIKSLTEDVRLLDMVQTAFRGGRFTTIDTSLSLPSKDVIVRWFVIPLVKPNEIQGVVAFEAKKHSPFPIEELAYTYHPTTISKDGMRQLGIVFVAIRKTALNGYLNVLRQVGLNVIYSEPASMSLLRALIFKKFVDPQKITAILTFSRDTGEIVIAGHGCVKFIRDFRVVFLGEDGTDEEKSIFRAKLFNEVKMSLDFFIRQQSDTEVTHIVAIASPLNKDVWNGLGEDVGLSVRVVDAHQVLEKINSPEVGHINAYGAGLVGNVQAVVDLNLSEGQSQGEQQQRDTKRSYGPDRMMILAIGGAFLSAMIFFAVWTLTANAISIREQERLGLVEQLGSYAEVPKDEIESKRAAEKDKLSALQSLSFQSEAIPFIVRLLSFVPEGIWFSDFSLSSKDGQLRSDSSSGTHVKVKVSEKFTISGFVYTGNSNAELQVINDFVALLTADEFFKKTFKSISLGELKSVSQGVAQATAFTITCE